MPLNLRASKKLNNFNVPVSYRIHDRSGKFLDARNVSSIQGRLNTRYGTSRYNTIGLPGPILSMSFFSKSDGSRYVLAKVGGSIYRVFENQAPLELISFLSPLATHRGITWDNRHIIALGEGVLYSYDGEVFTQLGSLPPTSATILYTPTPGGTLVDTNKYKVGLTYYASSIGFETNVFESAEIELSAPNLSIAITNIPTSPSNALIDKVYIYLKNVTTNSEYLFVEEIDLGATSYTILTPPLSSQIPPVNNGMKFNAKIATIFNSKLVVTGSVEFANEVYFSEENIPDAFSENDAGLTLVIPGKGGVTGLGVGLFGDSVLDPFLAIFKRKSTRIYSEIGGLPKLVTLSEEIGCVSQDSIVVKNGIVFFLSEEGWRAIHNGRFVTNERGDAATLAGADIDDIFKTTGYAYEVNRLGLAKSFSVYYPTLDQYITWVSEGTNSSYSKAYSFEFDTNGFKPYEFAVPATCAVLGEESEGRDIVLMGTADGYILKHSIMEDFSDVNSDGDIVPINAFAVLPWMPEDGDFDASYNFRELILRAITSEFPLTVKTYLNYDLSSTEEGEYNFTSPTGGFILDESLLDTDTFSDERAIVTARSDINRVGESIAIGFYQNEIGANIGLVSMQIDSSKNGNRNLATDIEQDGDGGFDSETETYLPSVSESVQLAASYLAQMQALIGNLGNVVFSGFSSRFNENWDSNGVEDTFAKILLITYAGPLVSLSATPAQTVREKGTPISSVDLTANTTKRTDSITGVTFYRGATLIHTVPSPDPTGATNETYTDNTGFSDTTSYTARATDGTTEVISNVVTYTFVYPYFHGTGAPGLSAASVAGLTKDVRTSTASLNRNFTTNNGNVYYFAYPASYGALTSIKDENNFETIGDWTLRTENITGLDGNPVSYRIYEFNNPVVAGSTNYTFIR